jgi:hypothetical protein
LLAIFFGEQILHLREAAAGSGQALRGRPAHQRISARPILGFAVTVEQSGAQDVAPPRVAALRRLPNPNHAGFAITVLEQNQAEVRLRFLVTLLGRLFVPALRHPEIRGDAASELIGLGEVELGVRIALLSKRSPLGDG